MQLQISSTSRKVNTKVIWNNAGYKNMWRKMQEVHPYTSKNQQGQKLQHLYKTTGADSGFICKNTNITCNNHNEAR